MFPNEIFLSHASTDKKFAQALAQVLRAHGLPVWFSRTNIRGAQQWHDEIGAALRRCDWFLVAFTPHSVPSMWVKRELLFALQQNHFEGRIVPLLVRTCDHERLSWTLSLAQFIDFTGSFDNGCRELLRIWGIGFAPKVRPRA
jgi:hypothetical protein